MAPVCRFNTDSLAATSQNGSTGSIWFLGAFYDNVFTARHGVTALAYPKPKLKFKAPSTVSYLCRLHRLPRMTYMSTTFAGDS